MENLLDDLNHISELMRRGALVLCPTDTIWGLSCDSFNEKSVNKIFTLKRRSHDKPLILLVSNIRMLKKYIVDIHPRVETLIAYYRRPISIIYQANENLPPYLSASDNSIAIRLTYNPELKKIIDNLGRPIVSTSANFQGQASPVEFQEIDKKIIEEVDYVFKSGRNNRNENPSLIIKFNQEGELLFLR